jgi:hypothetical protein
MDHKPLRRNRRPLLADRFELWLSAGRRFDGLWIGASFVCQREPTLHRIEQALGLIKTYDRCRYDRLVRDLDRVWVRPIAGYLAAFNGALRACELDSRFVIAETSTLELIAAAIVHEATHARLDRRGIAYDEALRPRLEAVCLRREIAFAAKLPDGAMVRDSAERTLALCDSPDYWTNAAFAERFDRDNIRELHDLGAPDWLIRAALNLRAATRRMRGLTRG